MTVVAHESPVTIGGWTGAGYEIIDPQTGGGAYLISGSASGGFIVGFLTSIFCILFAIFILPEISVLGAVLVAGWEIANFFFWIASINHATNADEFNRDTAAHTLAGLVGLIRSAVPVAELLKWAAAAWLAEAELLGL